MILVDAGQRSAQSFEACLLLAAQLRHAGLDVGIDENAVPECLHRNHKYDSATFVVSPDDVQLGGLIILAGETIADPTLSTLRGYGLDPHKPVVAIGRFQTRQQRIGVQSRIAYATGAEPLVLDLSEIQPQPILRTGLTPIFGDTPIPTSVPAARHPRILLFLPDDVIEDDTTPQALSMLTATLGDEVSVLCSAKGKAALRKRLPDKLRLFAYAELLPSTLAAQTDIVAVLGATPSPGDRVGQLCANVLSAGGIVIDATQTGCLSLSPAPVIRRANALVQLAPLLEKEVIPNQAAIHAEVMASEWRGENEIGRLIAALPREFHPGKPAKTPAKNPGKTLFLPTNGVGLGHAQRCCLVAQQMKSGNPVFAAFPSCIEMIERNGFAARPLIQKSPDHEDPFANDLVNYRRLKRWLSPGDQVVFDGVHVFDSLYRSILEHDLEAIWIRRGLWQAHQSNTNSLDREHVFRRVIVPNEAFDELNQHYSFGAHIHPVGPIVQLPGGKRISVRDTRKAISRQVGRDFDQLVVSMLGGGVAADRGPHLQTICAALEDRKDVLHLVVVWPNARVAPELALWRNSRIVRAVDALSLARAADFLVSAVGYNSFHEILYHQIPAILIPQMAPYMDDQERRARSAANRGLAEMISPKELFLLERKLAEFLDGANAAQLRARLARETLPVPGNHLAARIIRGEALNAQ